jgi:hypothetical protein
MQEGLPITRRQQALPIILSSSRMLKKASSKAAASEEARRTLRYVEPLSDARTPLDDFFSILMRLVDGARMG